MKATGIIRKVDELGRIVIPKELRKVLKIEIGTPLEIFTQQNTIVLRKYEPGCQVCGSLTDLLKNGEHKICKECLKRFK